ncbi:hypothetical protein [Natrinema soli]|uniref:Copper resistance protein D domain-containing protein n=1 Tax=Natrinema soli TaxID=1930624 RepID=A0ABD5SW77_9EURY|nr:hypothetical protein [Natrinema soli]
MVDLTLYVLMRIMHLMTAGVWAGWTVFMAVLILPAARNGRLGSDALIWLTGRFSLFSKVAPVVMFLTGMYMVGQSYPTDALLGSSRGYLVLSMIGLWLALSALTNVSSRRLVGSVESTDIERAAENASGLFTVAGLVALALLLVGGWL